MRLNLTIALLLLLSEMSWAQDSTTIFFQDVAWSPDGAYLYYSAIRHKKDWSDYHDTLWAVYRVKTDGSGLQRVSAKSVYVAVSPDGKWVATGHFSGTQKEIITIDSVGKIFNVSALAGPGGTPSWSPDGKKLAFTSRTDTTLEIYTADRDGKNAKRLTFSKGYKAFNPSWSPDGKTILYYLEKSDRKDQVHIIPSGGGSASNVTADTLHNIFPGWTPDGRIIYCRVIGKQRSVVITDIQRKNETVIPNVSSFFARVSPDGRRLAFILDQGIFIANIDGSDRKLATDKISN